MNKKGMDMYQLVLIILAIVGLVIVLLMIGAANNEVGFFTKWLGGVT